MQAILIFFLVGTTIKNIREIKLPNFTRLSIEVTKPIKFRFSADKEQILLIFEEDFTLNKNLKTKIPMSKKGKTLILKVANMLSASFFTLPWPFKILIDVTTKGNGEKIEDLIKRKFKEKPKLVVDAGHGGNDPGAIYGGFREKDMALTIAKEIMEEAKRDNFFDVFLSRSDDKFLELEDRTAISNSLLADVFVSIHLNSSSKNSANGFEVFCFSKNFSKHAKSVVARENGTEKLREEDILLFEISSSYKSEGSKKLADAISSEVSKTRVINVRDSQAGPLYVIAGSLCPAVLIEVGFITNAKDRNTLLDKKKRKRITKAIYKGIKKWYLSKREI